MRERDTYTKESHTNRETMMPMCHFTYKIEIGS